MSSRAEKIDQIIKSRKPIAEKTAKTVEQLKAVSASLEQFKDFLPRVSDKIDNTEQKNAIESLRPDFDKCLTLSSDCQTKLRQIELRFSRPTLNIGVVGNAGQGKSTLLQSLTGLQDEEIPTGGKGDCTGAAAIIENRDVPEAYADIEFYSESEFLNTVVAPYYRKLNLPQPSSLSELAKPLPSDVKIQENFDEVKFIEERLQHGLAQYRQFFGRSSERIVKNKIREYTAKSDANGKTLSIWTAVKSAKVYCRFPGLENEKISVGDTPGLGDRSVLEAEERLMKDFGRSIDAVMMMRRINVRGIRKQDVSVFNLIKQAIPELEADKWSYFLVNVFKEDRENPTAAEALKFLREDLRNSSLSGIQDYIEVDCSDKEAVLLNFDKILNGMASNQQRLDETLYKARIQEVEKLVGEIQTLVEKAKNVLPKSVDNIGYGQLQPLFDAVWKKVEFGLSQIVKEYRKFAEEPDGRFAAAVDEIKKSQTTYLKERLDKVSEKDYAGSKLGGFTPELQHELRIELSKAFDKLDTLFQADFAEIRQKAVNVFIAADKGKLGDIIEKQEPVQWLTDMAKRWQDIDSEIADTIKTFATSAFSFSAYLLPRVREKLNVLDSDSIDSSAFGYAPGDDWDAVREKMKLSFDKALNEVAQALVKLSQDVSRAKFAMIEQFADGIMRGGSHEVAKNRWYAFYEGHRAYVWTDIFAKLEENTALRNDWNRHVTEIESKTNELK